MSSYGRRRSSANPTSILICCCIFLLGAVIGAVIVMAVLGRPAPNTEKPETNAQETQAVETDNSIETEEGAETEPAPEDNQKLKVLSTVEQGEQVIVTTTYGTFSYPYAFSDLLVFEAVADSEDEKLDFYADVNDKKLHLFTLWFGGSEGFAVGTLKHPESGESVTVSVVFGEEPEGLSEDELISYYAAKELFNDIEQSLAENEGYVRA